MVLLVLVVLVLLLLLVVVVVVSSGGGGGGSRVVYGMACRPPGACYLVDRRKRDGVSKRVRW